MFIWIYDDKISHRSSRSLNAPPAAERSIRLSSSWTSRLQIPEQSSASVRLPSFMNRRLQKTSEEEKLLRSGITGSVQNLKERRPGTERGSG
ncbi:hypothetical protein OJAV_G00072480 [Oryzias javanicus]|uniref:Uncharacterized protein n=1 Tax=Oryzias javanicus TaxID=123683 RepID=A0A3S2N0T4_ORYJA|nr:hypothetical protein OJAV_G00072480 [Oryzias javanicus]